jgi:hypothetical protein
LIINCFDEIDDLGLMESLIKNENICLTMGLAALMEPAPTYAKKIQRLSLERASRVSPLQLSPLFFLERRYR